MRAQDVQPIGFICSRSRSRCWRSLAILQIMQRVCAIFSLSVLKSKYRKGTFCFASKKRKTSALMKIFHLLLTHVYKTPVGGIFAAIWVKENRRTSKNCVYACRPPLTKFIRFNTYYNIYRVTAISTVIIELSIFKLRQTD